MQIMQAVSGLQILILQLIFSALSISFQLTARVTVPCLWFLHPMSLLKYFKTSGPSLPDLKDQRIVIEIVMDACITCTPDDMAALL